MLNSRIVHAVALGSLIARTASWFDEPSLADAQFANLAESPETAELTVSRFDLEVPVRASPAQITDLVVEATYNLKFTTKNNHALH